MRIYTSYFANIKNIPDNITTISICNKTPEWYRGAQYKPLAPKIGLLLEWKGPTNLHQDAEYYVKEYSNQVLKALSCDKVYNDLSSLSQGYDICLLCYESPNKFCHRHLVADWLTKNNIPCSELGSPELTSALGELELPEFAVDTAMTPDELMTGMLPQVINNMKSSLVAGLNKYLLRELLPSLSHKYSYAMYSLLYDKYHFSINPELNYDELYVLEDKFCDIKDIAKYCKINNLFYYIKDNSSVLIYDCTGTHRETLYCESKRIKVRLRYIPEL